MIEKVGFENMCGCVKVSNSLLVLGYEDVFVIGDCLLMINFEIECFYLLIV